jgi:hypothetical protein
MICVLSRVKYQKKLVENNFRPLFTEILSEKSLDEKLLF